MLHSEEGKIQQYLTKYQNPDITKRDIMTTLEHYQGLSCKLEQFVFSNGVAKNLVQLIGTIPVTFKGTVYNIPVCIWIMDTHPNNAPMCYVKPTPDMHIKVSAFVDHNGKIYLPYLHTWSHLLSGMISIIWSSPTALDSGHSARPIIVMLSGMRDHLCHVGPARNHPDSRLAFFLNSSDLLTLIQVMIVTFGEQPPVYAKSRSGATSATPYPTQSYMPVPASGGSGSTNPPYLPYPPNPSYPQQSSSSSYPSVYPPYPYPYNSGPTTPYPYNPPVATSGGYPPYPPTSQMSPPQTTSSGNSGGTTGTITEEHIRASLLSAVEDKLRRRLGEQFSQMQAELETLGRTQQELTQGKNKLDEILARLEKEQAQLDKNITILQDKEQELEKAIARLSEQEPMNVDEAVTTTAPLYKQLLNAFAEEAATEDTIYYMGEALRRGVIDLDVFLKQVRSLSRKQFMLRALMHKCRQKAGLAG
ncbi:tumor susceptibility gene 101 protein isoform X1 [Anabrus simplex]|uniref:tumor susceptibility gene 101 protein isoform X1 n=1 Tax=Anabrus simplex TaxID=316456 RepID=UPI0035A31412